MDLPSDTDDEEERLDCVHDIRQNQEEPEIPQHAYEDADVLSNSETNLSTERRQEVNDEDMDGDVEDADGLETERRRDESLDSKGNQLQSKLRSSQGYPPDSSAGRKNMHTSQSVKTEKQQNGSLVRK